MAKKILHRDAIFFQPSRISMISAAEEAVFHGLNEATVSAGQKP